MHFTVDKKENFAVIEFTADKLDAFVAPVLKSELTVLNKDGMHRILLVLDKVKYCDSSGLSAILVGNRLCKNSGGKFVIAAPEEPIKKLITISQLDSILNVVENVTEGMEQLA